MKFEPDVDGRLITRLGNGEIFEPRSHCRGKVPSAPVYDPMCQRPVKALIADERYIRTIPATGDLAKIAYQVHDGSFEEHMAAPTSVPIHPALVPYVRAITVEARPLVEAAGDRVVPAPYRILPGIAPVIGFQFRGRLSVLRDTRPELLGRSGITGLQSTARWFLSEAETRSVIVRLAPFGGYVLLNQCMAELADRHVPLDNIMAGVEPLEDELQELGPHQAARRVQKWLLEQLSARKRDVHPDLIAASRAIIDTGGRDRVEAIAKDIGIGRRRLERLFQRQIGVAPKEFALLVRFEAVVREQGQRAWTDIALDAGYADQAHFIHDFKRRTGIKPTEFRRIQPR